MQVCVLQGAVFIAHNNQKSHGAPKKSQYSPMRYVKVTGKLSMGAL